MGDWGIVLRLGDRKSASHSFTLCPQGQGEPPPSQVRQSSRDLGSKRKMGLYTSPNLSFFIYKMGTK